MNPEGELQVDIGLAQERVASVHIRSTRPDVAALLLKGRTAAEVQAAVPALFSICGHSQAAACTLACAAAAGETPTPAVLAGLQAAVTSERVREAAWQVLLLWPRWLQPQAAAPGVEAVAAARAAHAAPGFNGPGGAEAKAIAQAALGMAAESWLAIDSPAALRAWSQAGSGATARFIRQLLGDSGLAPQTTNQDAGLTSDSAADVTLALLPAEPDTPCLQHLAQALNADAQFEREPLWHGTPAETGALARLQHDALVRSLVALEPAVPAPSPVVAAPMGDRVSADYASPPDPDMQREPRVLCRFVARLRELALLLARPAPPQAGALGLPDQTGLAWVHNARGLLVHQVQLHRGRVRAYRIVAPTEWNFHPRGAVAQGLLRSCAADAAELRARAARLVHSLDPCVACSIEIHHA